MRHSATRALLERDDVIIVASVSCIYGIGSVETYTAMTFALKKGERIDQRQLIADLVALQYKRTQADFTRGTFRVRGDVIDIFPAHYEDRAWRVNLFGDTVENIEEFDPLTGHKQDELEFIKIYANSHYVTPRPTLVQAIKSIKSELKLRLDELNNQGRLLEAQRLEQRTTFDLEMMEATGSCAGIENYSRYLTGRRPGEPPPTLFEYVPDNALVFADESHVTVAADRRHVPRRLPPQGDARRIRLPPALLHGQPSAAVRGMGHDAPAERRGVGDPERLGAERERRRVRRAGDPPDRADRSSRPHSSRPHAGRRSRRRSPRHRARRATAH
jgi:transcription-repair coupling factor (superfamily II helicase)